jgi:hypothetical protein
MYLYPSFSLLPTRVGGWFDVAGRGSDKRKVVGPAQRAPRKTVLIADNDTADSNC